jgi:membrane-bound ClpP family serine protease
MEDECFGIPHGGTVAGVFFGLIIMLVGISLLSQEVFGFQVPWWPFVVILFGVLIIVGAMYSRRRY